MKDDVFREILALLSRLQEAKIFYELRQVREDALMIDVHVPGERWEIEFVNYGDVVHVEVERFVSDGSIADESTLNDLFRRFSDKARVPEHQEAAHE